MKSFLLNIQYKGTRYFGWQIQNKSQTPTVQGELEKAIVKAFKVKNFKTLGASRTDRGVHALNQYCKLDIGLNIEADSIKKALNDLLPDDIFLKSVSECSSGFHPIFDCERKTYQYLFTDNRESIPVMFRDLIHFTPYELDLISMELVASKILGEHDFINFQCKGTEVATTIREIYCSEIKKLSDSENAFGYNLKDVWVYSVEGNGFLKQMVRLLMGGMLNVGRGKITIDEFASILNAEEEKRAGKVVGPEGLYLTNVVFKV